MEPNDLNPSDETPEEVSTSEPELVQLSFEETRVLGSLIEKELTTPEYYPMSLNGLVNACNQKNNRLPKTNLSEEEVNQSIEQLRIKRLAHRVDLVGSRVPKFQHNAEKELDLIKAERALICELLHVDDLARGVLFLLQLEEPPDWVNLGTGIDHSIEEIAELVKQAVGFQGNILKDETKPDGMPVKRLDVSLINSLGWQANTALEDGVPLAYEDFLRGLSAGTTRL